MHGVTQISFGTEQFSKSNYLYSNVCIVILTIAEINGQHNEQHSLKFHLLEIKYFCNFAPITELNSIILG
jgi:hypothetical protein